ncbi:hypothetical protein [Streptosporangium lutulentum]|uniref:Uncharacterized protein n=1 Tax=Streptosporangium lutulentum TaxID=1461250 RepID=A0ABT9QEM3_9ACTN|nr:hypothetical protein [Streptosporangium lutulentum]MDP9844850.1 hypothetical protein [Streptosporangium lutulentum]
MVTPVRGRATSLDPIKPVPPIATIFLMGIPSTGVHCHPITG